MKHIKILRMDVFRSVILFSYEYKLFLDIGEHWLDSYYDKNTYMILILGRMME